MAQETYIPGDLRVAGNVRAASMDIPPSSIEDGDVRAGANIAASKLEHQHALAHKQAAGAAVVNATENLRIVRGQTGLLISVDAMVDTAPTGADRTITIDVLKGNVGSGFATLLASPLVINNTHTARQVVSASLVGSPTLAAGDTVRVTVTVAGAAGAQGQGLNVSVNLREKADP
jgi:hypothetical protein